MTTRARPLPPAERRAALVAATMPLLSQHGPGISTRQIAEAAGVAEGTIYRAFPDKESLIRASLAAAFDPAPAVRRLRALDGQASLADRLTAAVTILQERLADVFHLISAFGLHGPHDHGTGPPGSPPPNVAVVDALADLLAPDAERLRLSPAESARLIRLVVFAGSHPRITDDNPMTIDEIVELLLHGISLAPDPDHISGG